MTSERSKKGGIVHPANAGRPDRAQNAGVGGIQQGCTNPSIGSQAPTVNRITTESRLSMLPEVFTTKMVEQTLDGNKGQATVYTQRWKKDGLIATAGPKVGIFFNLYCNRRAEFERAYAPMFLAFPSAIIARNSVLYDAGWTTQQPQKIEVIVERRPTYPQLYKFDISGRSRRWLLEIEPEISRRGHPRLSPYGAVVDMCNHSVNSLNFDRLDMHRIDWERMYSLFSRTMTPWPTVFSHYYNSVNALESTRLLNQRPRQR